MPYCGRCGAELLDDKLFCTNCGARIQLNNNSYVGKICPYCQMPIKPNEEIAVCPECRMPHHQECWEENKGCTSLGCEGKAAVIERAEGSQQIYRETSRLERVREWWVAGSAIKRYGLPAVLVILILMVLVVPMLIDKIGTQQLIDLPLGTIVYDPDSLWEFRSGKNYTHGDGTGFSYLSKTKPVEWIIVAKNHTGYPANSVTLLSTGIIARYPFDSPEQYDELMKNFHATYVNPRAYNMPDYYKKIYINPEGTYEYNISIRKELDELKDKNKASMAAYSICYSNHWGNKDSADTPAAIRAWLNNDFYNHFSPEFKDAMLTTALINATPTGEPYTTKDKIFIPSQTELGNIPKDTYSIGFKWEYSTSPAAPSKMVYWTRSPQAKSSVCIRTINTSENHEYMGYGNPHWNSGVRPVLNVKSDIQVKNGKIIWE